MSSPSQDQLQPVLIEVLSLMSYRQPQDITFSMVARKSKVPRSTLYYRFNDSRENMISESIQFGMDWFTQMYSIGDYTRHESWEAFQTFRMKNTFKHMAEQPWAPRFLFRYRNDPGTIGKAIRQAEERYFKAIGKAWTHYKGSAPNISGIRFSTYLKLGVMFGFSVDQSIWKFGEGKDQLDSLLERLTTAVTSMIEPGS